ncbi:hypothetical protein HMPREF1870_02256 [Bacteroidales bacterium KA00344]|nr:hypothetical protein HMPREF1870_02256 [Bacteroidales bacterium KA00344]
MCLGSRWIRIVQKTNKGLQKRRFRVNRHFSLGRLFFYFVFSFTLLRLVLNFIMGG